MLNAKAIASVDHMQDAIAIALHHNLDSDEAHDIAKTLKDFSCLS
jgi:flagellin-specific chaperone FliS